MMGANASLESRIGHLERMVAEIHARIIGGSSTPTLDDVIDAALDGDVSVLDDFLKKGGKIPTGGNK